jgi:NADP-dependent 3-hydroxy acid dehydrogenase YdfG
VVKGLGLLLDGGFIQVSSVAGKLPAPGQSLYAATKHAVNGFFHTLRSEVRSLPLSGVY